MQKSEVSNIKLVNRKAEDIRIKDESAKENMMIGVTIQASGNPYSDDLEWKQATLCNCLHVLRIFGW